MARIGRRDQEVILQRYTTEQNDYGEEVETWSDIGSEWAAIFYGRGSERRQAAMERGAQPATFQMLSNPVTRALTVKDRIEFGAAWDIVGVSPDTPERGLIEITAVRGA
ncbi:MAG: phage head-tail joining protein [Pelagibaca sp.]|nr:phage head-tail joining protein [Pelagibaca sp.]